MTEVPVPQARPGDSRPITVSPEVSGMSSTSVEFHRYVSPMSLPPPEVFSRYNEQTQRALLEMAQKNQDHRIAMDQGDLEISKKLAAGATRGRTRGQYLSAAIVGAGLVASCVLGMFHQPAAASIIGITALGSLPANRLIIRFGKNAPTDSS
jgi:uncharacterized membrane protein